MAKDPAFLFYPGDYLRDTQTLSEKSQVAYDRIMCEHMRNICISQQQLKFFTKRLNPEEIEELMFTLTKIDGGYCIEWIAESIKKRKAYSESRRKNRVSKSKKHMSNISKTYVNHMENENEDENINKDGNENGKFKKPKILEIQAYFQSKGVGNLEADKFYNFYESKGWMVGKNKMQKWKSAAANWITRKTQDNGQISSTKDTTLKKISGGYPGKWINLSPNLQRLANEPQSKILVLAMIEHCLKLNKGNEAFPVEATEQLVKDLFEDYPHMSMEDVALFFKGLARGDYGKTYGKINYQYIHECLRQYDEQWHEMNRQRHKQLKEDNIIEDDIMNHPEAKKHLAEIKESLGMKQKEFDDEAFQRFRAEYHRTSKEQQDLSKKRSDAED